VLASASTVEAEVRASLKNGGNVAAAMAIGKRIAGTCQAGRHQQGCVRSFGLQVHGRIKALADAAREAGLEF